MAKLLKIHISASESPWVLKQLFGLYTINAATYVSPLLVVLIIANPKFTVHPDVLSTHFYWGVTVEGEFRFSGAVRFRIAQEVMQAGACSGGFGNVASL